MTEDAAVAIREADLSSPRDARALVALLDSYARTSAGQGEPLDPFARANLVKGLQSETRATVLFACSSSGEPIGVAVCQWSFATFSAKRVLNVHDLVVHPSHRGRGIGSRLLAEVERRAREAGCGKLTLEVHDHNEGAKRLYDRHGFGPFDVPSLFLTKPLCEREAE